MENYSVILENDLVVKASNFGGIINLKFNKSGKVKSFLYEGLRYIGVYTATSGEFVNYCEQTNFRKIREEKIKKEEVKYNGVDQDLLTDFIFKKYENLIVAQDNDTIYGLLRDSTGLCYNYFIWQYLLPYSVPLNPQPAPGAPSQGEMCETLQSGTVAKSFFDSYKNEIFYDTNQNDVRLIGEIASLLKQAGEKTALAFQNFVLEGVDTNTFTFTSFQDSYPRSLFLDYKKGLELWLKMLEKYQTEISKLGHEEKLFIYIDVMYRHNMLTNLSPEQRISILKILVEKRALMNWYWVNGNIGFVHKEDLALYIFRSVDNLADTTDFLNRLVSTNVIDSEIVDHQGVVVSTNYISLYKLLFYRMDDYLGEDNFTEYVKELQRIVLLKNGIPSIPTQYEIDEFIPLTKAQFIWRAKGNLKKRITYKTTDSTQTKITIKETAVVETKLVESYSTSSVGTPVFSGYNEIVEKVAVRNFELNHFDLVSIHFYDNPSFIDLSTDQTYVGRHFLTFAGFIDYILEKENTKIAEDIFNAALLAVTFALGFGEVIAAIRTVNIARAVSGLTMVFSDAALYLNQNTPFRNYIINTYGQQRGNEILSNMALLSTLAALGSGGISGSGILNRYSKEEGLRFVGTGEAILKDSNAISHLTTNEINALEEAIKKIKNELYSLRNNQDAVNTIVNTKANVFFNKFDDLQIGLSTLSQADRLAFYKNFNHISEKELNVLRNVWLGLNNTARVEVIQNSSIWLKYVKVRVYLRNGQYEEVIKIFNGQLVDSEIPLGYPNLRYLDLEDDILETINIANMTNDINLIHQSYPEIPLNVIARAKQHYYIDKHLYFDGQNFKIGRFGRNQLENLQWMEATQGFHFGSDLNEFKWLLAHEYIEAKLMENGINFRSFINPNNARSYDMGAHYLSPLRNEVGEIIFLDLGRLGNPPELILYDLSNVDEIVNWYINFYKL